MNEYSTKKTRDQYIYDQAGHRIGNVRNGILYRSVHEKHLMYSPPGLAFDNASLNAAKAAGAEWVVVHRMDCGIKMRARLADYFTVGFEFDYGRGPQRGLKLDRFQVIEDKPADPQMATIPMGI